MHCHVGRVDILKLFVWESKCRAEMLFVDHKIRFYDLPELKVHSVLANAWATSWLIFCWCMGVIFLETTLKRNRVLGVPRLQWYMLEMSKLRKYCNSVNNWNKQPIIAWESYKYGVYFHGHCNYFNNYLYIENIYTSCWFSITKRLQISFIFLH